VAVKSAAVATPVDNTMKEWIRDFSDKMILWFLAVTSGFGKELTDEGRVEQRLWRQQRLRDLSGLAIRSRQRLDAKKSLSE
jgi:hypothetical protein